MMSSGVSFLERSHNEMHGATLKPNYLERPFGKRVWQLSVLRLLIQLCPAARWLVVSCFVGVLDLHVEQGIHIYVVEPVI